MEVKKLNPGRSLSVLHLLCCLSIFHGIQGSPQTSTTDENNIAPLSLNFYQHPNLGDSSSPSSPADDLRDSKGSFLFPLPQPGIEPNKRASFFYPLRGKKNPILMSMMDEESKRSKSNFFPQRGKKISRKVSSFYHMRGRKRFEDDESDPKSLDGGVDDIQGLLSEDMKEKRPSSIVAMSGKKEYIDEQPSESYFNNAGMNEGMPSHYSNDFIFKRPSLFVPMRGRKRKNDADSTEKSEEQSNHDALINTIFNANNGAMIQKRRSKFIPMRGKKPEHETNNLAKGHKQPPPGFQPISSSDTKSYDSQSPTFFTLEEDNGSYPDRPQQFNVYRRRMSFIPMRGKKSRFDLEEPSFVSPYPHFLGGMGSSLLAERRPFSDKRIVFHAMRGKKRRINWDTMKRTFQAVRGKRSEDMVGSTNASKEVNEDSDEGSSSKVADGREGSSKNVADITQRDKRSVANQKFISAL